LVLVLGLISNLILSQPAGAQGNDPANITTLQAPSQPFAAGVAAYDRGAFALARRIWLPWAHKGDPAAQRNLAHLYRMGLGVAQDFTQAASWYRLAADNGLARAQANLAAMYLRGQGVAKDPQQAAYWFTAAATGGHVRGQYNLALLYMRGQGVGRNEAKAAGWFYRAAQAGHKPALRALGKLVAVISGPAGPPVPPVPMSAQKAQVIVAAKAKTEPEPEPKSVPKAATPVPDTTAEPTFLETLAALLSEPDVAGNESDPEITFERRPVRPVPGDIAAGLVALHAANFAAARTHWQPLAENGHVEAQYQLGKLYLRSEFAGASISQSFFWLARAAAQSHTGAKVSRDALERKMSTEDRAEARKLLRTLQSTE
jgi:TPR repeat protein